MKQREIKRKMLQNESLIDLGWTTVLGSRQQSLEQLKTGDSKTLKSKKIVPVAVKK